ncbi:sugar ABC transporter permease [Nonomuraea sp. PA05]|uniref:carbohydrate ABC transporter permease n=1 Tax=Nonomuraea sp. PA05 TaxID=2604466 RepID=UPI0011D51F66|nr:sugar ABC transporter permease [Nonomuraea sp. PA05]TYB71323.1 sugar ABC transporter permease [Nonomuraea sp. PA05]
MTATQQGARAYRAPRRLGGDGPPRGGAAGGKGVRAASFLAPALALLAVFQFWPIVSTLLVSFTDSSGFNEASWVGLGNYAEIVTDPDVRRSFLNTGIYTLLFTPSVVVVALLGALLLNRRMPVRGLARTVFFMPFVMSFAVAALAWQFLLDPNVGLVSYWLSNAGVHLGDLLESPAWAMPTVVFVAVWKMSGFYLIIFLAGLQGIPRHLYEAAMVDGAGVWRRFTSVTLPGLMNSLEFVMIFALIAALQAFDQIYILTKGGPYRSTETVVMTLFTEGFGNLERGLASALAMTLMVITLIFSAIQYRWFGRREGDQA